MTRTVTRRRQRGQALVVMALVGVVLFGVGALALDQGIGMSDRRDLQAIADSAALAGARSLSAGTSTANYVALEYAARNLGLSPAIASPACSEASCAAGTHSLGDYRFTLADNAASLDLGIAHTRRTLVAGVIGFDTEVTASAARASSPGPSTQAIGYTIVGLGGDVQVKGGGTVNPSGDVTGPVYARGAFGTNNGAHAVALPANVSGFGGGACAPATADHVDTGGSGDTLAYTLGGVSGAGLRTGVGAPSGLSAFAPTTTGPTYAVNSPSAWDASGNWNPGTYSGWYPTGNGVTHTRMNPGVYVIQNVTTGITLRNLVNAIATAQGTEDPSGAVAIVLDSSDNGSDLSFSSVTLNGIDDLSGGTRTPPDPQGTHNMVIYGNGFTGTTDFGGATLSGIIYLPDSTSGSNGTASWTLTGSVWMNSFTLSGGGNGSQTFQWVCGLGAISANGGAGSLVR